MIRGLGIDVAQVSRIEEALKRHGDRFLKRIFTATELAYCAQHRYPARHYAARFAAKEATMKALGTGLSPTVSWKTIEVVNLPSGQPTLRLSAGALERARRIGADSTFVTLTHDAGLAQACVVLEGPDGAGAGAEGSALAGAAIAPGPRETTRGA